MSKGFEVEFCAHAGRIGLGSMMLDRGSRDLPLRGGHLCLWSSFLGAEPADRLLERLWSEVDWAQHHVRIGGRRLACPRLSAWYGEAGARYRYSGQTYEPLPLLGSLREVETLLEAFTGRRFNSVLVNAYRSGDDSMGWHSDDEPELGEKPVIASLSLGETRRFRMRSRTKGGPTLGLDLDHGSLLVMDGDTQKHWQHAVPKTRRSVGLRINLTFRRIVL